MSADEHGWSTEAGCQGFGPRPPRIHTFMALPSRPAAPIRVKWRAPEKDPQGVRMAPLFKEITAPLGSWKGGRAPLPCGVPISACAQRGAGQGGGCPGEAIVLPPRGKTGMKGNRHSPFTGDSLQPAKVLWVGCYYFSLYPGSQFLWQGGDCPGDSSALS